MKEYKITKERLEAMAKKCPEAKEVLKEGFPEAFTGELENIGHAVRTELWQACGRNRYAIKFFYKNDIFGTMWADGKVDYTEGYKVEKDDSGGEPCLKFFKFGE